MSEDVARVPMRNASTDVTAAGLSAVAAAMSGQPITVITPQRLHFRETKFY
jgi:hypothetical protein